MKFRRARRGKNFFSDPTGHRTAVLQALLVTFLWSTSWVLIKIGLADLPPIPFAGLRYFLAFLFLLPVFFYREGVGALRQLEPRMWIMLSILGLVFYGVTQGAQFVSLAFLPAVTANLILGFTPVIVAVAGIFWLAERPSARQWVGIWLSFAGVVIYFYPVQLTGSDRIGLLVAVIGMLANAGSSLWGRQINRGQTVSPLVVTVVSMGVGALLLLAGGAAVGQFSILSWQSWLIVSWLALINTAFAFTLWNHTLRTLSAMESALINNTMAVQIPILAVIFLGERLSLRQTIGLIIVVGGVFLVQIRRRTRTA